MKWSDVKDMEAHQAAAAVQLCEAAEVGEEGAQPPGDGDD
jgi:hypothetical protein